MIKVVKQETRYMNDGSYYNIVTGNLYVVSTYIGMSVQCQSRDFPNSYAVIISCFTTLYCWNPKIIID